MANNDQLRLDFPTSTVDAISDRSDYVDDEVYYKNPRGSDDKIISSSMIDAYANTRPCSDDVAMKHFGVTPNDRVNADGTPFVYIISMPDDFEPELDGQSVDVANRAHYLLKTLEHYRKSEDDKGLVSFKEAIGATALLSAKYTEGYVDNVAKIGAHNFSAKYVGPENRDRRGKFVNSLIESAHRSIFS